MTQKDVPMIKEKERIIPTGTLKMLRVNQIKASSNNPRRLFDDDPLKDLRENIRENGVLVPITVYPIKGQDRFGILDGERRFRCCQRLSEDGQQIEIPANIVEPPTRLASVLYMFSIHNFREQWELMPTALALENVLKDVGKDISASNRQISTLTGLSDAQIERCRKLLSFPKKYQDMSLEMDPKLRIASNFWIEALPVIELGIELSDEVGYPQTFDEITDKLVQKYRLKKIKSVIHFRKVVEAWDFAQNEGTQESVRDTILRYINDPELETRKAFDTFVVDNKRVQNAIESCSGFIGELERLKLSNAVENRLELYNSLLDVKSYIEKLLAQIEGTDAPSANVGATEE